MKPLLSLSLAILTIGTIATSCGSSRSAQKADPTSGAWQQQPLTIDGSDKDWTKPLPYSVKSDQLSYAVTNDNQNLYILMTTSSPQEQQKIVQGGMTVWVNTKGDKSYAGAVGIGYPLDPHTDRDKSLMEEAQPQRKNNKPVTLEDKHDYQLYGFDNGQIPTFTYGDANTQGIVMRMDYNDAGALVYEASIPLQTLYPGHNTNSSYASKTVAVGFLIEGLLPGTDVPRGSGGGGGPTIGVGGGVGFGSFGSGGGLGISIGTGSLIGGGGGGRKQLFRQSEVWQTVQLSGSTGQPLRGF
jgi:hypothetical protein